ncbi:uncharacterized protein LOC135148207 [Daucus carota subsp. sativus]|uniref:uncharacterized protein LOC135148207 n=1 Tax=Daucus carota subsp. sativus TaxID=79200 RepID=UPI00308385F6
MTIQDKLTLALPDKYNSLFSYENQPQSSTAQTHDAPTSGPSQQAPVVKSDHHSPKRILRSSKSSPQPSPSPQPKRKRKFLQPISDSDDEDTPPPPSPPPVKQYRKKIKPTSVTDLTVDPPVESVVSPLAMVTSSDPVFVEPLSAVPLDESSTAADIPISETTPDLLDKSDDLQAAPPTLNQESLITAEIPAESTLPMHQESLLQIEDQVADHFQEITCDVHSEDATEALASHTLSISVVDDDDATEVTSISVLVPISDPSPVKDSASEPPRPSTKINVCHVQYHQGMCRSQSPSLEARITNIEATQNSMQSTLAELSSSGEKITKDKCSSDQPLQKKKPGDDKDGKGVGDGNSGKQIILQIKDKEKSGNNQRSNKVGNSDRLRESKQSSLEMTLVSPIQSLTEAVRSSGSISKELTVVDSVMPATEQKGENLISESDKLIEAGDPEFQKFCQTLKFRGKETTLFYKSPSLQAIDEAVAKKIFERENPGIDIEAIRLEEERLAAEKMKISKSKSDKQKQIIDPSQKQSRPKEKGIVIGEINYSDITRPRTRSQSNSETESKNKGKKAVDGIPIPKKTSIVKITPEVSSQRLIQLSKATKIISDVSGIIAEEEDVGLTRKNKTSKKMVKSASDLNLTSDNAQVKIQETKAKSDQSESMESLMAEIKL